MERETEKVLSETAQKVLKTAAEYLFIYLLLFFFNGHTFEFRSQSPKLEEPCSPLVWKKLTKELLNKLT